MGLLFFHIEQVMTHSFTCLLIISSHTFFPSTLLSERSFSSIFYRSITIHNHCHFTVPLRTVKYLPLRGSGLAAI
jgi:hypothetical protein